VSSVAYSESDENAIIDICYLVGEIRANCDRISDNNIQSRTILSKLFTHAQSICTIALAQAADISAEYKMRPKQSRQSRPAKISKRKRQSLRQGDSAGLRPESQSVLDRTVSRRLFRSRRRAGGQCPVSDGEGRISASAIGAGIP
jgi:hypothetical protein